MSTILYFDTEFTKRAVDGTLISLGIISEDGKQFYAEFTDYNKEQVTETQKVWNIRKNIIDKLFLTPQDEVFSTDDTKVLGDTTRITQELATWLVQFDSVEFVCDTSSYSFVFLMQLFGGQDNLPPNMCPAVTLLNTLIARDLRISTWEALDISRQDLSKIDMTTFNKDKGIAIFDARVLKQISENMGLFEENVNESFIQEMKKCIKEDKEKKKKKPKKEESVNEYNRVLADLDFI